MRAYPLCAGAIIRFRENAPKGATAVANDALRRKNSSGFEGVLHVLTGLLEVALARVRLALGLQVPVTGGPTDPVLDLAYDLFDLVLGLVLGTHRAPLRRLL